MRLACLSHAASVQAEPGSNSSIEFLGTANPDARCNPQLFTAVGLTETDTFTTRVYPRNEFVQTRWIKTFLQQAVTAPAPAKAGGQSR